MSGVVVLTGGVGGAKLVHGLALAAPELPQTAIINTGDDFRHLGLHVSPDIDTVLYTLSGKANVAQGWGREGETWNFLDALSSLGGETWFKLGDGDLALHVARTARLAAGESLSQITQAFARAWEIKTRLLPMSDQKVATMLDTEDGELEFQRYFVELRCAPRVRRVWFEGARQAHAAPGAVEAILKAEAVLIAPSNPYLSVDPILAVGEIAAALKQTSAPVVAVSPLVGGAAVKGPTAKLMLELGHTVDNARIGEHYAGVIDGLLAHEGDAPPVSEVAVAFTDTLMRSDVDRARVAAAALQLARDIDGA